MRFLGIDYGTKRIGVAISDENGTLAFPKEIIPNDKNALKKLGEFIKEGKISEIVFGESLDLSGKENKVNKVLKSFAKELESLYQIKISFEKEFLTTVEARRPKDGKKDMHANQQGRLKQAVGERVDAGAAALILQRYLDKNNKQQG